MKYRKKPVVIDAVQWTGNNWNQIQEFMSGQKPKLVSDGVKGRRKMRIQTLEGAIYADVGDFIIKGVQGEFYPCKPDIFEQTYYKYTEAVASVDIGIDGPTRFAIYCLSLTEAAAWERLAKILEAKIEELLSVKKPL